MRKNNYWASVAASRIRRRRLLASASTFAFGSAILVACGGGDSGEGGGSGSDLIFVPKDTTKEGVRGGTLALILTLEPTPLCMASLVRLSCG
jgi:hypothetical protein